MNRLFGVGTRAVCNAILASFLSLGCAGMQSARAGMVTWTGTTDANWDDGTNWNNSLEPTAADDVVLPVIVPASGSVITLTAGELANSLTINNDYTLTGGDLTLTAGGGGVVSVAIDSTATIASKLTGSAGLTKEGRGTLYLSNSANDYTGATTINLGMIVVSDPHSLGSDTSAIVITGNGVRGTGGGNLSIDGGLTGMTFTRDLAVTGYGLSGGSAAFTSYGNNTLTGNITTCANWAGLSASGVANTSSNTILTAAYGTTTISTGTISLAASTTYFGGRGNWVINSLIDGAGALYKTGSGSLVLTGTNTYAGITSINGGYLRVSSNSSLGVSTAATSLTLGGGTLEVRTDSPDFSSRKVTQSASNTIFVDRAVGGSGINQTVAFNSYTITANYTQTIAGRNGYGLSVSSVIGGSLAANSAFANNANGLVTFTGNMWNQTNTSARTLTFSGHGDTKITGSVTAANAAHILTKSGTGVLTIVGTGSTYTGVTNVLQGTMAIADFRSLNAANTNAINLGTTSYYAAINVIGSPASITNATTSRTINLVGTTGGAVLLANQSTTALSLTGDINNTGAGNKTLYLGGVSTLDNTIGGVISNYAASAYTTSLTKVGSGTWMLTGSNTYTGTTTIDQGVLKLKDTTGSTDILSSAGNVVFTYSAFNQAAGGTLNYVGYDTGSTEQVGALVLTTGSSTISVTAGSSGTTSLQFASLGTRSTGAMVDYQPGAGQIGFYTTLPTITNDLIASVAYSTYNGVDWATLDANGNVVAFTDYVTTIPTSGTGGSKINYAISENATTTGTASVNTLKIIGSSTTPTLTLGGTLTLTARGLLFDNSNGSALITGSTISASTEVIIITNGTGGASNVLTIDSLIGSGSTALTKSGSGTLVIAGANTYTGNTYINEGTIRLSGSGTLGNITTAANVTYLRQNATLDLHGVSVTTGAIQGAGTITNSSTDTVTLTLGILGTSTGSGYFTGLIEDGAGKVNVTKNTTGTESLTGVNTYSGVTTIAAGTMAVTTLANIGVASGIGKGDATSDATNAASLVFAGGTLLYTGANGTIYQESQTPSVSINRLFTLAGNGTIDSSGKYGSPYVGAAGGDNHATLIFNNTGPVVFSGTGDRTLTLTGTSTGDNEMRLQLIDNPNGGILSIAKDSSGVWLLGNTSNTYTGTTTIRRGTLRALDGKSLPTDSALLFAASSSYYGTFESIGTFTRGLGTGAGQVSWSSSTTGGGGFAAADSKLTVAIGGTSSPTSLVWGSGGFTSGYLVLNSATALAEVELVNNIDLNGATRTIQVDDNAYTGTDFATISGNISGTGGLTKTGSGMLFLTGANSYTGDTAINGGWLFVTSLGNSTGTGTSSVGAWGASSVIVGTGTTAANLAYIGTGETSDRAIVMGGTTTGGTILCANGSGEWILSNVTGGSGTGARTLYLRGDSYANNELTGATAALSNGTGGGTVSVTKDEYGTWIMSGQNTYTGSTSVSAGILGIGASSVMTSGTLTSGPLGTGTLSLSNGTVFAAGADRTLDNAITIAGSSTNAVIGDYSMTWNGVVTLGTGSSSITLTNSISAGSLTINGDVQYIATATNNKAFIINGSGNTIIAGKISEATASYAISLAYNGYGTLTLANSGNDYKGDTTLSGGTLKLGADNAIPSGVNKGNLIINPTIGLAATLDLNGHSLSLNGLTANSTGTATIDNSSASASSLAFGLNDKDVTYIGSITQTGGGAVSITKTGSGTAMLSQGPYNYTGTTTINGGTMTISGAVTGTTGISVTGNSTLNLAGSLTGSASTIVSIVVDAGSTLSLYNGVGTPLSNLATVSLGTGTSGTATLELNLGDTGSDTLTIVSGGTYSIANKVTFNIRDVDMSGNTSYTLLSLSSGATGSLGDLSNYTVGTAPGGYVMPTGGWLSLSGDGLNLLFNTGTLITGTVYWGNTTLDGKWNTGSGSNWYTDKAGTIASTVNPGSGSDVVFIADTLTGGGEVKTTLEQDFRINSLKFEASTTPANTPSSVIIDPGADLTYRLNISPNSSDIGITLAAGGPASVNINTGLKLGANQTWTVADATSTLTVDGALTGTGNLTTAGSGKVILKKAADGAFGASSVTVSGGTLELNSTTALGSSAVGNMAAITIGSGGTFYYAGSTATTTTTGVANPITLNGGTLTLAGATEHYYNGSLTLTADSFISLADYGIATSTSARNLYYTGTISGANKITVSSYATTSGGNITGGGFIPIADNSGWTGGLQINGGSVYVRNINAVGSGAIQASAGRLVFDRGTNDQTYNFANPLTIDGTSGNAILEVLVDNSSGTPVNFTMNQTGKVTLGGSGATPYLRITQADVGSYFQLKGGIELKANASIHVQGVEVFYGPALAIDSSITESGGSYSLTFNGDTLWGVNHYQNVELNAANSYSGGTILANGRLILNHLQAIGTAGDLTLNGGYLKLGVDMSGSNAFSRNLNIGGTATLEGDNFQVTGTTTNVGGNRTLVNNLDSGKTLTITGDIKLSNDDTGRTFTIGGSGTTLISGAITDGGASAGTFAYTGTGALTLTATNTYTGGTTVNGGTSAGTLVVASTSNLSSGSLTVNAGTLELNNAGQSVIALTMGGGAVGTTSLIDLKTNTLTLGGNVNYSDSNEPLGATIQNGTLNLGDTTRTFTVEDSSAIASPAAEMTISAAIIGTGGLTKADTGTLALVGLNTFSGPITVSGGTLQYNTITNSDSTAASSLGLGSNPITLSGGALSFVGASSQSTNRTITFTASSTLDASGLNGATIDYTGAINVTSGTLYLTGTGEGTISGVITQVGTSADLYVNSGTWHLTNASNYFSDNVLVVGPTSVLTLDTAGVVNAPQGTIYVRTGGTLRLNANDTITSTVDGMYVGYDAVGEAYVDLNGYNASVPILILGCSYTSLDTWTGNISGAGTLSVTTTMSLYRGSISSNLAGGAAITKDSPGTVTLSGDNSGLTGATAVNLADGNLILNYTTSNTVKLREATAVNFNGGTLTILGNASAATSQTVAGATLASGWNTINVQPGAGQTATLNLGAITRNARTGVVRFETPTLASGGIVTTTTATNGILGGWATIKDSSGATNFATVDENGYVIGATSTTRNDVTTWGIGENVTDSTGYTGTLAANTAINSLRFNASGSSTVTIGPSTVLAIGSGGILATDALGGTATITGGTLVSGSSGELIVTNDSTAHSLVIASNISGSSVTKSGEGTLVLSGTNGVTDAVNLWGGTLVLQNGSAVGDFATVTIANDHDTALTLEASEAIGGLAGGNALRGNYVNIGSHTLTVNNTASTVYAGYLTGDGTLIKEGDTFNLNLTSSSAAFTGSVLVNGGLLHLSGSGRLAAASSFTVNKNGSLLLDNNGSTRSSDRIANTTPITLNSADGTSSGLVRGLWIRTDQAATTNETIGTLTFNSGANYVTLEATGGTTTNALSFLIADDFVRNNHATLNVRGRALGTTSGANRNQLKIGTTANETAFMSANLVGGDGSTSTNTKIVPWVIGETLAASPAATNMGNTLVTYVASQGFVPLDLATAYATYIASADTTDNVRESLTASLTGLTGKTVNSLVIHNDQTTTTDAITVSGTGTLTNTSGAFLFTLNTGATASTNYSTVLGGFDGIQVGSGNEYIFHVVNPSSATTTAKLNVTVDSLLTSADATLVKSGLGTLILTQNNTYGGGTVINEGLLQISDLSKIGTGNIDMNGGGFLFSTAFDPSARTITLGVGGGVFDTNGLDIALANSMGNNGVGGLTKNGTGTLTLSGANLFSGDSTINVGTVAMGTNTAMGTGSITLNGTDTYLQLADGLHVANALIVSPNGSNKNLVLASGATAATYSGNITILETTAGYFDIRTGAGTLTIDGVITGGGAAGVNKYDTGTLVYGGVNTYTGRTLIYDGTLKVAAGVDQSLASVLYFGDGATTTAGTVDLTEANAIFGGMMVQTNSSTNVNTVTIGSGKALTLTGDVMIGSPSGASTTTLFTATGGGALTVYNPASNGYFAVGGSTSGQSYGNSATADLSGLSVLNIMLNTTNGGVYVGPRSADGYDITGKYSTLILPAITNITAASLNVGISGMYNAGNTAGQLDTLLLGSGDQTIHVDTVNIGTSSRALGCIKFNGTAGTLTLRAADGTGRVAFNMGSGSMDTSVGSTTNANTFDVTGHSVDLLLGDVTIGTMMARKTFSNVFSFDTGTLDMTSLTMSARSYASTQTGSTTSTVNLGGGTVRIGSGSGTAVTMATNSTAGSVIADLNLTGGNVTILGNVVRGDNTGTGSATATITLNGAALDMSGFSIGSATNTVVLNAMSGTLSNLAELNGGGILSKTGDGTLILAGTNTYTGLTEVSAGTLLVTTSLNSGNNLTVNGGTAEFANSQVLGALNGTGGTVNVVVGTTLTVGSGSYAGSIAGSGSLTKGGTASDTLILSGSNSVATTTISAGTLQVDGSLSSTAVTAASGTTLQGSGTVSGTVSLAGSNTISGMGTNGLTVGTLNVSGTANSLQGTVTVNNTVTLDNGTLTIVSGGSLSALSVSLSNSSTLDIAGSLYAGTPGNYTGQITVNGSGASMIGNGMVHGNVTLQNGGVMASTLTLYGTLTVTNGSNTGGGTTTVENIIAVATGTYSISGTGTTVNANAGVTVNGGGTLAMADASILAATTAAVTVGSDSNGAITLGTGSTLTSTMGVNVGSYGTLTIDSGAQVGTTGTGGVATAVLLSGGQVINNGVVNGDLTVDAGGQWTGTGAVDNVYVTGGTFTLGSGTTLNADTVTLSSGSINLSGQTAQVTSFKVGAGTTFTTGVGGHLIDTGNTVELSGTSTVDQDGYIQAYHLKALTGSLTTVVGGGAAASPADSIDILGGGDGLEMTGAMITLNSNNTRGGTLTLHSGAGSTNSHSAAIWVHTGNSTIQSSGTGTYTYTGTLDLGGDAVTQKVYLDSGAKLTINNLNIVNGNLSVSSADNTSKLLFSGSNSVEGAVAVLSGELNLSEDPSASLKVLTVGGGLTVGTGATLEVGSKDGSGEVTVVGNTSIAGTISTYIGASGVADLLVVDGTLTLSDAMIRVNLASDLTESIYYLVEYNTAATTFSLNSDVDWGSTTYNHTGYQLGYNDHSIYIAVVPEPSTWAMLLTAGMMGAIGYWWRRRTPSPDVDW